MIQYVYRAYFVYSKFMTDTKKPELTYEERQKRESYYRIVKKLGLWSGVLLALALTFWGLWVLSENDPSVGKKADVSAVTERDWQKGGKDARVTLIEYGDFQCPACAYYFPMIRQLEGDFGDSLRIVYRHFPLSSHKYAQISSRASEAAGKQGRFWEMHDKLYDTQETWSSSKNVEELFAGYAGELGLDVDQFKNDLNSDEIKQKVGNDYDSGIKAGVNSTPSFFINGEKVKNSATYDEFKKLISEKISESSNNSQ